MNDSCPSCQADFDGGPIPENIRQHYSPPYRWSRKIGLVSWGTDRVEAWQCPDCKFIWDRSLAIPPADLASALPTAEGK